MNPQNNITLTDKFIAALDEVYSVSSRTARLESDSAMVRRTADGKTWKIAKMLLQGAGTYSRTNGFPKGAITLEWENFTFENDRGREFNVDAMDDQESLNIISAHLVSAFLREEIVPELDAIRFAKYYAQAGEKLEESFDTPAAAAASLNASLEKIAAAGAPADGKFIFVSNAFYSKLREAVVRTTFNNDGYINTGIREWDNNELIAVPDNRFHTEITLLDGTTEGQEQGGYTPGGVIMNYIIIDKSAVVQITKHQAIRVFAPDVNQEMDAWKFQYRIYHDAWVLPQKAEAVIASAPAAV